MYLVQDLSALLGIFSDPFSSPPPSYPGHMVVIWGKNQGLPFPKQYRIFPFAAQFLHPTLSRLWSGIAQSHVSLLSAVSLLPGDIEWVGKHCRCIRTVYCSSEFLVFWDNFDLFILVLVFFDIWDLNKRHCPIFFSVPFLLMSLQRERWGPNIEELLAFGGETVGSSTVWWQREILLQGRYCPIF